MFSKPKDPLFTDGPTSSARTRRRRFLRKLSPSEKLIGFALLAIVVSSGFILASRASGDFVKEVPASGGEFTEGIVGSPRFINPLLAISNADRDLTALVYAGLMRSTNMGLRPELAESFSISEDGLTYQFTLRQDATFHDGRPVTADDVLFTIEAVQNSAIKSPRFANWEGVSAIKVSDYEVEFRLEEPYAPFLENTTLGILPKHIWEFASAEEFPFSEFNISPIGAGPFRIDKIRRNDAGIPETYELVRFNEYALGRPHIKGLNVRFFRNEDEAIEAYLAKDIDALNSVTPNRATELDPADPRIIRSPLPRIFGVFFNQNRAAIFARQEVREALDIVIDKQALVDSVLFGYGTPINSPIPIEVFPESMRDTISASSTDERYAEAAEILEAHGWERNATTNVWERESNEGVARLTFSISTSNTPELAAASEYLATVWRDFGADVSVEVYEPSDLSQNVIRPRRYDALFFGEIIGRELDLFAFWHSSQRNDPGLNIAMYTSISADALLKRARTTSEASERLAAYAEFEEEIQSDAAAVFVYSPDFIYIAPKQVQNISIDAAAEPSERFLNIHEWYIETQREWHIFD